VSAVEMPSVLGALEADDKFRFEGDMDIYVFVSESKVSFITWNKTKETTVRLEKSGTADVLAKLKNRRIIKVR
jgi:hypothetical protein